MSIPLYEIGARVTATRSLVVHAATRVGGGSQRWPLSALSTHRDHGDDHDAFADAARAFLRLRHPHLAVVEHVLEMDGRCWAVVPALGGAPLSRTLEQPASLATPWCPLRALDLVLSIAEAAHAVSEASGGSALGRLSADSVWIGGDGMPILLPCAGARAPLADDALARYVAPEVIHGAPVAPSADVYSLALLLWDLLALGRARQPAESADRTSVAPRSIHSGVVGLVMRSLSALPAERPADALAFHAELARLALPEQDDADDSVTVEVVTNVPPFLRIPPCASPLAIAAAPVRTVSEPARVRRIARVEAPPRQLRVVAGDVPALRLDGPAGRWVVGRARSADLVVEDPDMSREHFEIVRMSDGEFGIYDLGSKNGVFVNGALADQCILRSGDEVRAGETRLRFEP